MCDKNEEIIKENERLYLSLLNDTISRMASNSASCKKWAITIVTALLAADVVSKNLTQYLWIAFIPIAFFYWLDSYYLYLEISFRYLQKKFLDVVKGKNATDDGSNEIEIFDFNYKACDDGAMNKALSSNSTWPFYLILFLVILVIWVMFTWGSNISELFRNAPIQ